MEFNPVVYPRKLFVAKGSKSFVDEHFSNRDGSEIKVDYSDAGAWAHKVICKDNNNLGVLIWIECGVSPGDLCHEVIHAVNAYVHDLGTTIPNYEDKDFEEYAAYIGGWMYDCVWKFKTGKV